MEHLVFGFFLGRYLNRTVEFRSKSFIVAGFAGDGADAGRGSDVRAVCDLRHTSRLQMGKEENGAADLLDGL